jgi:hypothetical protein
MKDILSLIAFLAAMYFMASLLGSLFRVDANRCHVQIPFDYILYTRWFCPIGETPCS